MLQKIRGVRQDDASRERHWFQDDYFDLFVWTDAAGKVLAFQLCYDRLRNERVLAWNAEHGWLRRSGASRVSMIFGCDQVTPLSSDQRTMFDALSQP